MFSFLLLVVAPVAAAGWYLYTIANDQYASTVGFSVRSEEIASAQDLLGGLSSLSGSSSSDTDILYEFIQSQEMVEKINSTLDLGAIFSRPEYDPVFAYDPTGDIEDLMQYWPRMVRINYDSATGLIELRVQAFTAQDAQDIARAIVRESTERINRLSAIAREDTTRYARADLEIALERLKNARETLTRFRSESRVVDPSVDLQGQVGLLNSLEEQLAEAQIEMNLLLQNAREGDPRMTQTRQRIEVIEALIEDERTKFGIGGGRSGEQDYSTLVGEFERITVDVEYAEASYLAALSSLDTATAEAQRQSRYLATYIEPTLAQSSRYPQRELILISAAFLLLLSWAILVLIFYSLRDRQ